MELQNGLKYICTYIFYQQKVFMRALEQMGTDLSPKLTKNLSKFKCLNSISQVKHPKTVRFLIFQGEQRQINSPTDSLNLLSADVTLIEYSQLICTGNHLSGFYMRATLALNGLNSDKPQVKVRDVFYIKCLSWCLVPCKFNPMCIDMWCVF